MAKPSRPKPPRRPRPDKTVTRRKTGWENWNVADNQVGGSEGLAMGESPANTVNYLGSQSYANLFGGSPATPRNINGGDEYSSESGGGYSAPTVTKYALRTPSNTSWWQPLTYSNGGESEILASAANALIPTFASDEQLNIAKWLSTNFSDFQGYSSATQTPMSSDMSALRKQFFSKDRAQQALSNLDDMRMAMRRKSTDMGAGYNFLRNAINLLDKYSGEGGISRGNYSALQADFAKLSEGVDSSYVELGRAFINPSVGGNPLMQSIRANGRDTFGTANTRLFT